MIHMCYRCKALIDLTQAQEMIRSTPDEAKGTTYDNLCEYVKICQAAEQVLSKSQIMEHTEFGALVDTLEGYEIDIPVFYFRSSALQFVMLNCVSHTWKSIWIPQLATST